MNGGRMAAGSIVHSRWTMARGVYPHRVKRHAVIQPQDSSYKIIALSQGQNTKVDAEDYDWLNQWPWQARWNKDTHSFYALRTDRSVTPRKTVYMSAFILGCKDGEESDHRNHDTLDNRRENLRKATKLQNIRNRRIFRNNTSGFQGVSWHKRDRVWCAHVRHKGILIHLGYFDSAEEAARAHDELAKKLHGEFAVLNFETLEE